MGVLEFLVSVGAVLLVLALTVLTVAVLGSRRARRAGTAPAPRARPSTGGVGSDA